MIAMITNADESIFEDLRHSDGLYKGYFLRMCMRLQQCNLFRIKINFFSNIIIERYTIIPRSLIKYEQDERNFPSKISTSKH